MTRELQNASKTKVCPLRLFPTVSIVVSVVLIGSGLASATPVQGPFWVVDNASQAIVFYVHQSPIVEDTHQLNDVSPGGNWRIAFEIKQTNPSLGDDKIELKPFAPFSQHLVPVPGHPGDAPMGNPATTFPAVVLDPEKNRTALPPGQPAGIVLTPNPLRVLPIDIDANNFAVFLPFAGSNPPFPGLEVPGEDPPLIIAEASSFAEIASFVNHPTGHRDRYHAIEVALIDAGPFGIDTIGAWVVVVTATHVPMPASIALLSLGWLIMLACRYHRTRASHNGSTR